MKLKLLYFAWLRNMTGVAEEEIEVPADTRHIHDLVAWLSGRSDGFAEAFSNINTVQCSLNLEYVELHAELKDGDEVGFFPPVTGG